MRSIPVNTILLHMGYLTLTQFKDILKNVLVLATEAVGCMRLKSGGCDLNVWWIYLGTPDFKTPMLHMWSLFCLKNLCTLQWYTVDGEDSSSLAMRRDKCLQFFFRISSHGFSELHGHSSLQNVCLGKQIKIRGPILNDYSVDYSASGEKIIRNPHVEHTTPEEGRSGIDHRSIHGRFESHNGLEGNIPMKHRLTCYAVNTISAWLCNLKFRLWDIVYKQVCSYSKLQVVSSKLKQIPLDFRDAWFWDTSKWFTQRCCHVFGHVFFDESNTNCPKSIQLNKGFLSQRTMK